MSQDGATLYLGSTRGIYAIDSSRLSVRAHWQTSTQFLALTVSSDGAYLFGLTMNGNTGALDQIDARTGRLVSQVDVPLTLLGVEGARAISS